MIKRYNDFILESSKEITDEMKSDIIKLNGEFTLDDIKNHFLDLTDYNAISFENFRINFSRQTTTKTTYPIIDVENDVYDYDNPIVEDADIITYKITVNVYILRDEFRDKYLELRHDLTIPGFQDLYNHKFIEFNSPFTKYPSGDFNKNEDRLEFWPKKSLWL